LTNRRCDDSASDTGAAFQQDDTEFNIFNTDRQLSALESAVKMLGSLNEKKALVYFASGMTRNGLDNQAQLKPPSTRPSARTWRSIPSTLAAWWRQRRWATPPRARPAARRCTRAARRGPATSNFQGQQETLYTLASDTGGKALLDNNDLSMGIVQAQKDISSYYIIGYYSANEALDGRFRRVKITLERQARLRRSPSSITGRAIMPARTSASSTRRTRSGS
jgi:VWFA-related protein